MSEEQDKKAIFDKNIMHEYGIDYLTESEIKNCKTAFSRMNTSNKLSTGGLFNKATVQDMVQGTNSMGEAIFYQNMVIMSQLSRLNHNINVLYKKIGESIDNQTKELKNQSNVESEIGEND